MFGRILLFFPRFSVLLEDLEAHGTPVRSTQRTLHALSVLLIVLEAPGETLRMNLPTAAIPTV